MARIPALPGSARLGWYVRRLRAMGPAEMLWRVGQAVEQIRPVSKGTRRWSPVDWPMAFEQFRDARGRPLVLARERADEVLRADPGGVAAVVAAADATLDGEFNFFGYPPARLRTPIDWNLDPLSGYRWPVAPARSIDHRTAPSDPKWIWELNRLQHLPWLAQAWLFTGQERYAAGALEQLDSWLAQCPPGEGIAWRGGFETGIRAISIGIALQGLSSSPELTVERYRRAVEMLGEGVVRSWRQRSRFSSANNHLVGELAGVVAVLLLFPELGEERLRDRAIAELAVQASLQILADGAGAEQAVAYQVFTADLLLLAHVLLERAGHATPVAITAAIRRSARYLSALVGADHPDPRYGDGDDGFALRLGAERSRTIRAHLGAVAAALGESASVVTSPGLDSRWLATGSGAALRQAESREVRNGEAQSVYAASGGLVALWDGSRRITMDVGPLGYLATAAHGHADALSITLSEGGHELIGDPGPASYYGHPDWRAAHRGTRAHGTVCVDGVDQSEAGGPFLWASKARVRVLSVDLSRGIVVAEHDGYRRLPDPVTHRRWLVAPPGWREFLVLDLLVGLGAHGVTVSWPLHPDLASCATTGEFARLDGLGLQILSTGLVGGDAAAPAIGLLRGDGVSGLGWWSDRLESRTPAWLATSVLGGPLPLCVATVVDVRGRDAGEARIEGLQLLASDGVFVVRWRGQGGARSIEVGSNPLTAVHIH